MMGKAIGRRPITTDLRRKAQSDLDKILLIQLVLLIFSGNEIFPHLGIHSGIEFKIELLFFSHKLGFLIFSDYSRSRLYLILFHNVIKTGVPSW